MGKDKGGKKSQWGKNWKKKKKEKKYWDNEPCGTAQAVSKGSPAK